jgi:hypothetical protein
MRIWSVSLSPALSHSWGEGGAEHVRVQGRDAGLAGATVEHVAQAGGSERTALAEHSASY